MNPADIQRWYVEFISDLLHLVGGGESLLVNDDQKKELEAVRASWRCSSFDPKYIIKMYRNSLYFHNFI